MNPTAQVGGGRQPVETAWCPTETARRAAGAATCGAVLATLVNPFGPRVYESAFGVTFNSTVRRFIGEWQSPDFHDPATLAETGKPGAQSRGVGGAEQGQHQAFASHWLFVPGHVGAVQHDRPLG